MNNSQKPLQHFLAMLRAEHRVLSPPEDLRDAVLHRLDESSNPSDVRAFRSDAPETIEELMRASHVECVESVDFVGLSSSVLARLESSPASPEDHLALAPEWDEVDGGSEAATHTLDAQAVALFRDEVGEEVRALEPEFRERFPRELARRIDEHGRSRPTPWHRVRAWWRSASVPDGTLGWGLGLAGAAAMVAMVAVGSGWEPEPALKAQVQLHGQVSVDALDFEGDVMMIPDEGVTVVVLSGV